MGIKSVVVVENHVFVSCSRTYDHSMMYPGKSQKYAYPGTRGVPVYRYSCTISMSICVHYNVVLRTIAIQIKKIDNFINFTMHISITGISRGTIVPLL